MVNEAEYDTVAITPDYIQNPKELENECLYDYYMNYKIVSGKCPASETVQNFEEYAPDFLPLVHPSPRNHHWVNKNPWFEKDVVPYLRQRTKKLIG